MPKIDTPPPPEMVGGDLRKIRLELGYRQSDLAEAFDVLPRQIRRWESGESRIPALIARIIWLSERADFDFIEHLHNAKNLIEGARAHEQA